ncbi:CGNR zinc finger domain-containing protein [Streptomyces sp. CC224B]|uniref:CGNR zinc finger domain-containing protein n=1 Tax=Streptomyces sp. CC224B TaxID=3044571 RepID=UPI0024A840D7|nr:CGNR zinc finger domain-containing protein [Streptomyces sp. CC224B]
MQFNHYGGEAALLAADLVNAYARKPDTKREPDAKPEPNAPEPQVDLEQQTGTTDLSALLVARGVVDHTLTAAQQRDIRAWAHRLAPCFGPQDLAKRCARLNALLDEASSRPRIALHDGTPHFHYSAPGSDPAAHVRALTAAGLASIVCHADARRLGRCARTLCGHVFVDTSRAGRRTYCSVRCANNDAVARHRATRRPD